MTLLLAMRSSRGSGWSSSAAACAFGNLASSTPVPALGSTLALALGSTLALAACSAPALPGGYQEAERLERAGRFGEARLRYAAAAAECKAPRADCALVAMRAAQMYVRMRRPRKAVLAFVKLARGRGAGLTVGARALYRAASILCDLGEQRRAESLLFETIDSYPEMLAADDALRRLVDLYRRQGRAGALLPLLKRRFRRFARNDIADNLLYEAAGIMQRDLGRPEAAAALYLELARTYPKSPLLDDSLWLAGRIRWKQKRYRDAILIFKRLLATREDAFGGASYLSEWLDDSQLAIAKIWLLGLRKPRRAQAEFRELISSFDSSVLRDDAQHWIVLCEVERGRLSQARRALAKLRRDYPDSRYSRAGADVALDIWFAFRRAARGHSTKEACAQLVRLRALRPRPWLAAHAPRIPPWPNCGSAVPRPSSERGSR